jgi:hypothetical protein
MQAARTLPIKVPDIAKAKPADCPTMSEFFRFRASPPILDDSKLDDSKLDDSEVMICALARFIPIRKVSTIVRKNFKFIKTPRS